METAPQGKTAKNAIIWIHKSYASSSRRGFWCYHSLLTHFKGLWFSFEDKEMCNQWPVCHDVHFSCAIIQPLLAHHCRVHQCLLTSRFIAPAISWGLSAPGGKMRKQLLKDHNFLNNSPIFITESSTFNRFAFQKALHITHFNLKTCFGFSEKYWTP